MQISRFPGVEGFVSILIQQEANAADLIGPMSVFRSGTHNTTRAKEFWTRCSFLTSRSERPTKAN